MKKLILLLFIPLVSFGQVNFIAELSKNQLEKGETLKIWFKIDKDGDNFIPPDFENFEILYGPSQSIKVSYTDGVKSHSKSYLYYLKPIKKGVFEIGVASIEVKGKIYKTKPVVVNVNSAQKVKNYESDFLKFSYYDSYTLDKSRYYMDSSNKNVKLSCNSCSYGSLSNIVIIYFPIGNSKINMIKLFDATKKETESNLLKMGVKSDFSLIKIGYEIVRTGKEIPYFTYKLDMEDSGTTFGKQYIYNTDKSTIQLTLTTSSTKELSERQSDIDIIFRTLKIKL